MQTLFWLCRHGETTDSGKGIFRGQRDSALDKDGFIGAHEQRDFLVDKDWHFIFCSPMIRTVETATIISNGEVDERPIPHERLKPWDIGYLAGKDKKKFAKDMEYYVEHPDKTPEGGESLSFFQHERIFPLLTEAMEIGLKQGKPCIVCAHSSVIHALSHLLYGEHHHKDTSVEPGGIVEVYYDKGEFQARAAFKEGHDDSSLSTNKVGS